MFVLSGLFLIHFFLVIFSLLYLALRKKLCIKDHKDPKNLCEKIVALIINERYKGYGRNMGRSDDVMCLVFR